VAEFFDKLICRMATLTSRNLGLGTIIFCEEGKAPKVILLAILLFDILAKIRLVNL
jgi:hypothetical protein